MWFQRIRRGKNPKAHPEAEEAIRDSSESLERISARDPEVHAVAEASRKLRRENHFAQDLQHVFGGRTA